MVLADTKVSATPWSGFARIHDATFSVERWSIGAGRKRRNPIIYQAVTDGSILKGHDPARVSMAVPVRAHAKHNK
jgi:hypothetical protein